MLCIPVGLLIFGNLQKRNSFIEGEGWWHNISYKLQMPVESEGQIHFYNVGIYSKVEMTIITVTSCN